MILQILLNDLSPFFKKHRLELQQHSLRCCTYGVCPSSLEDAHCLAAKGYLLPTISSDGSHSRSPSVSFLCGGRINLYAIKKNYFDICQRRKRHFHSGFILITTRPVGAGVDRNWLSSHVDASADQRQEPWGYNVAYTMVVLLLLLLLLPVF
jgi:hypothetical protein